MVSYDGKTAPSHRELMQIYQTAYEAGVAAGDFRPLHLPYDGIGVVFLLVYLCIPHTSRPWLYAARWPLLAFIAILNLKVIIETKTTWTGNGFGGGLISAWMIVLAMTWLVWNKPQFDAKRVERRVRNTKPVPSSSSNGSLSNGMASRSDGSLKQRQLQNRDGKVTDKKDDLDKEGGEEGTEYYWQPYPAHCLSDRIDWVIDLVFNFRGPGWNWEVPTNPTLPAHIKKGLGEQVDLKPVVEKSSAGIKTFSSRAELVRYQVPRFVVGYLMLDALKVIFIKDPYFLLGPSDFPPPQYLTLLSPFMLKLYRQVLSSLGIVTALETIFRLAPLGLGLIVGPKYLGLRGEWWMFPTTWGSFDIIFNKGLQGFWGGWWHQTFRFAFSSPANFMIEHKIIKRKSVAANLFSLLFAFGISGFLHSCGSLTQVGDVNPWNPFLFFMLQGVGILLQTLYCQVFRSLIKKMPSSFRTAGNFAFTLTWLHVTSSLLVDEFARGGLWLFQPVPISPLRALGFGVPGDSWWCWENIGIGWYRGNHWWEYGIAF